MRLRWSIKKVTDEAWVSDWLSLIMCWALSKWSANELERCYSRSQAVMRVHEKVFRQEEAKQGAEEEEPGEDLCNLSAYNMRPSWARSPYFSLSWCRSFMLIFWSFIHMNPWLHSHKWCRKVSVRNTKMECWLNFLQTFLLGKILTLSSDTWSCIDWFWLFSAISCLLDNNLISVLFAKFSLKTQHFVLSILYHLLNLQNIECNRLPTNSHSQLEMQDSWNMSSMKISDDMYLCV